MVCSELFLLRLNSGLGASVEMGTMVYFIRSIALFLIVSMSAPAAAGKLDKVRDEIKKDSSSKSSASSKSRSSSSSSDTSSSGWSPSFDWDADKGAIQSMLIFAAVVTSPFWAPYPIWEKDRWEFEPGFLDYPYQGGMPGYGTDDLNSNSTLDSFAGRLQLGAGLASWGYRLTGDLRIALDSRLDIHLTGFALVEEQDNGDLDKMYFLEPGVSWLFALGDRAQFRMGAEIVLLLDPKGSPVPGITGTYAVDWFPADPLVLTFEFAAGVLGERFYSHSEFTLGLVLGPIEPFVGYEARFVGDQYMGTGSAGLRIWF